MSTQITLFKMKNRICLLIIITIIFTGCSKKVKLENKKKLLKDSVNFKQKDIKIPEKIAFKKTKIINENQNDDPIDSLIDSLLRKKEQQLYYKKQNTAIEKGIYLTAYSVAGKEFINLIQKASESGFNTVIFDLKNMNGTVFDIRAKNTLGDVFYFKNTYDIRKVVKSIHSENMEAVVRVVMFHDMKNANKDSLLCPFYKSGKHWVESNKKGPAWLDPSNRLVRSRLLRLISWIAKQGVDEVQLDYVRFPTQGKISQALFSFMTEDSLKIKKDSLYVKREKDQIIADFVKNACLICHAENVKLSADIFAITAWQRKADILATGQNLRKMTPYLDKIHPMIYSSHFDKNFDFRKNYWNNPYLSVYEGSVRTINNSTLKCSVIPYIQGNSWRVKYNKQYIYSQIAAVEDFSDSAYKLCTGIS